jgi:DNA-directed RNA polymerase specialized sigma24 family protein
MENKQDLTTLTDKELLYLIRQNEGQALLMLFDRYAAALYNHVLPQVRARTLKDQEPEDVARNILIDIFTSLWDNQNTLSIATTVRAYLFADAYHRAAYYLHHRKNLPPLPRGGQGGSRGYTKSTK